MEQECASGVDSAQHGIFQCNCKRQCWTLFDSKADQRAVEEFRLNLNAKPEEHRNKIAFNKVRDQIKHGSDESLKRTCWTFASRDVCLKYWCHVATISREKAADSE